MMMMSWMPEEERTEHVVLCCRRPKDGKSIPPLMNLACGLRREMKGKGQWTNLWPKIDFNATITNFNDLGLKNSGDFMLLKGIRKS